MAYYAIYCADSANGTALRKEHHEAHLKHIGQFMDKLMLAGPCPPMAGNDREASFLVVEAADAAAAQAIVEGDPFHAAGVWDSVIVREFKPVVGAWAPKG
jgi:uncharacterized protein YciI